MLVKIKLELQFTDGTRRRRYHCISAEKMSQAAEQMEAMYNSANIVHTLIRSKRLYEEETMEEKVVQTMTILSMEKLIYMENQND